MDNLGHLGPVLHLELPRFAFPASSALTAAVHPAPATIQPPISPIPCRTLNKLILPVLFFTVLTSSHPRLVSAPPPLRLSVSGVYPDRVGVTSVSKPPRPAASTAQLHRKLPPGPAPLHRRNLPKSARSCTKIQTPLFCFQQLANNSAITRG